jgi:hypothetical protein
VSDLSQAVIFISYRRGDSAPYARLMQRDLRQRFPNAIIFLDVDSIAAGLNYAEVIRMAVESCAVLVALIGPQWATVADERKLRRLDNPDDLVRAEIQTALKRRVPVIPVRVQGAIPLVEQQLPDGLKELAQLNDFDLLDSRYDYDMGRILDRIGQLLAAASGKSRVLSTRAGKIMILGMFKAGRVETEVPLASEMRVIDNRSGSVGINQIFQFAHEWHEKMEVKWESAKIAGTGDYLSSEVQSRIEQMLKTLQAPAKSTRREHLSSVELMVAAGEQLKLTFNWKEVWAEWHLIARFPDGAFAEIPYRVTTDMTYDVVTETIV